MAHVSEEYRQVVTLTQFLLDYDNRKITTNGDFLYISPNMNL